MVIKNRHDEKCEIKKNRLTNSFIKWLLPKKTEVYNASTILCNSALDLPSLT